jgi:hypothetical protein
MVKSDNNDDDDDSDAPYFSLVTGTYESSSSATKVADETDLSALPGQGKLTTYSSAAADFLRQREYQGLVFDESLDPRAAIPGQKGIASNYGER